MSCNSPQLLERVLTDSNSPYIGKNLQGIYNGILNIPGVNFGEQRLETKDRRLEFCLTALSMRFRQQREALKSTDRLEAGQIDDVLALKIEARKTAEANSWCQLVDFEALTIASGVAEFSEQARRGSVKDFHLTVLAGGKRNQGSAIYTNMWGHLGRYAAELNAAAGKPGRSYVPELGDDLTSHFETLPPAAEDNRGIKLARLGRTVIYGSLQGAPESPTNVILNLDQKTQLPFGLLVGGLHLPAQMQRVKDSLFGHA